MKLFFSWILPLAFFATSCTVEEPAPLENDNSEKVFARIESVADPDTRVFADRELNVLWNNDDRISLFNRSTDNLQYRFTGEDGLAEGEFQPVNSKSEKKGEALDCVYSVYPYQVGTTASNGTITLELPTEQRFAVGTFGPGANTMVSATDDPGNLLFKNLCGYFILKLYGEDVSVKSIALEGKNKETLAGIVNVAAAIGATPSIVSYEPGFSTTVTLTCPDPVKIGSTAETSTTFWLAVPPTTFSQGFTITITDSNDNIFKRSATSSAFAVSRNTTFRMKPLQVVPEKTYLVTNRYMQKYMEEVHYADMDFTYSALHGSPLEGGGPSENNEEIPPTIKIEWPDLELNTYEHVVVDLQDDGGWKRSYDLERSSTSLEVTNLVPGRRYTYIVHRNGSTNIRHQGSFYTRGTIHQVFFPKNVRNGRDLGGWKTLDGKTVRFRKLYRGGKIDRSSYMDDTGKKEMLAEGILAEIDLREKGSIPSSSPLGFSTSDFCAPGFDRGYYPDMLETRKEGVKQCFEFTVRHLQANKPVYFHCSAGRDRTGTFAILLLGVLGVREGDIAKDYELTYFSPEEWSMQTINNKSIYNHTRDVETYRATVEYLASFDKSSFQAGVEKYLLFIGVSQTDIDSLRSLMLE